MDFALPIRLAVSTTFPPTSTIDEDKLESGQAFDGSSIPGWKGHQASDMLIPDCSTANLDPFREEPTLILSCDVVGPSVRNVVCAHALHTQIAMHQEYGGGCRNSASRDHIHRVVPLTARCCKTRACNSRTLAPLLTSVADLAGALLWGQRRAVVCVVAICPPSHHHLKAICRRRC